MQVTSNCQPSNPGNGNKLNIARLTEIKPHNCKKVLNPAAVAILETLNIAIIPPNCVAPAGVKACPNAINIAPHP